MKKICLGIILSICMVTLAACGKETVQEPAHKEKKESHTAASDSPEDETKTSKTKTSEDTLTGKSAAVRDEDVEVSISEVEAACEKLMYDLSTYEYVVTMEAQLGEVGGKTVIDMNDREITRAAGLACPTDSGDELGLEIMESREYRVIREGSEVQEYSGVELAPEYLDKVCRELFGRGANPDSLSTTGNNIYDVIRILDEREKVVSMWTNYETETDFVINDSRVKEHQGDYILEQMVYYGYWGCRQDEKSNFKLSCGIERNERSKYGYVVSYIMIQRIDDETTWNQEENVVSDEDFRAPFYGVWCYSTKSDGEAEKGAEAINAKGFAGKVFVTTDWSNLNPEKWYIVTAGVYDSEEEAKSALSDVKSAGYPDAYVKYSGDYIGD